VAETGVTQRPLSRGLVGAQLRRELALALRSPSDWLNPLLFLWLATALFAIGFGGDPEVLAGLAPVIVWVLVLLANLLASESLFRRDFEDGSLEQLVLLAEPAFLAVFAKLVAHWLVSGLLLALLAPLTALTLSLPAEQLPLLLVTLLLGTPALTLLGAVGAALTVGLGRGGVLLALLTLPLQIPVLLFGAGAVLERMAGVETDAQIYWLGTISMIALTVSPFAVLAALRVSVEQ
jgi:heme exporter protein B